MRRHAEGRPLQVRGSALWARLEWVRETHGEEALRSLLSDLSPAGRNLIHAPVDRSAWYNFPLFLDVASAIDRRWGPGDGSLNVELGRWGCHRNTPALYSVFIRLGSLDWVLARASKFWSEHFNAGALEVWREPGQARGEGLIHDFPTPHLVHCYSVLGFALGCIELSGKRNVRGEMVSCRARGASDCRMRAWWDE